MKYSSTISYIAFALFALSGHSYAHTVGEYMAALDSGPQEEKEKQIMYFNGALDALMYSNETIVNRSGGQKLVCFPEPFPSRETLYKKFLAQVTLAVDTAGMERAAKASVDQMIFASWMKNYPCRK